MALKVPTYDIESINWTEPIGVGFSDDEGTYHEFIKFQADDDPVWDFLQFLESGLTKDGRVIKPGGYKGITLLAHNAAKYDAKFILASLQKHQMPVRMDAGLFRLVWLKPRIAFEDSYAAMPGSLRDLADGFGVSTKLDWDHEDTNYPWKMRIDQLSDFRTYMKRDCVCLSEIMDEYCKLLLRHYGVTPSLTLALTAAKAFDRDFYRVKDIHSNEKLENQIRAATYGGRNEVYKMYGENLNFYDVRSMYVSCYDVPVPIRELLWTIPSLDKGSFAYAKVKVPRDLYIGPLPVRYRGRLIFPVGEIPPAWWDIRELRYAVELGCDITIVKQLEADEEPVLKEFADYTYNLRLNAGKEIESRLWKLFGLRLSGKFGQSRWQSQLVHSSQIEDFTGGVPLDENEEYHEFMRYRKGNKAPFIKPAVNARIRAEARVRHTKLLMRAHRQGDIFYCDTDSIVCNSSMSTGPKMGRLQLVNKAQRGYFLQCKFYGYITMEGELKQISAGFRDFKLSEWDFQKLLDGTKQVEETYLGLNNWRDVLKQAEVRGIDRGRRVSGTLGFRNRKRVGQDTLPLIFKRQGDHYVLDRESKKQSKLDD